MVKTMQMNENDYQEHVDSYDGYCTHCDAVTREGMTEPDAERYPCDECGKQAVMGVELALVCGHIEIGN
jgi:hypothetical protein